MIIIENGTIRAQIITNSEQTEDENGYPVFSESKWSDPIGCHIKTNNQANLGVTDMGNAFETSSFEVLIEDQPFEAKVVELACNGVDLGTFRVQGTPEHLSIVGCLKILVKCLSNV